MSPLTSCPGVTTLTPRPGHSPGRGPRTRPRRPPGCGECDQAPRMLDCDGAAPRRCPRCKPPPANPACARAQIDRAIGAPGGPGRLAAEDAARLAGMTRPGGMT